jgi:hypothetical protein
LAQATKLRPLLVVSFLNDQALDLLESQAVSSIGLCGYDDYRRQGLSIMTSAVESVIKMMNKRVKGSEKFWSEPGAEAILQLRADYLGETETMSRFWLEREAQATSHRPYRRVA